jgi:lipopolysaccharide heptosyltransferase II
VRPPSKILILQLRRIGDVVVTTPVIDVLRAAFPRAVIDFLVEPGMAPILENYPGLSETLLFDKGRLLWWAREVRRRRYDWVLDFMNNPRTAQLAFLSGAPVRAGFETPGWGLVYTHRVPRPVAPLYNVQHKFNLLRALGVSAPDRALPRLSFSEADFAGAAAWWRERGLEAAAERVAVLPMHRHPVRQWPLDKFADVMERLLKKPGRVLALFGGPGEEESLARLASSFAERVHVIPPGALRRAGAILSRMRAAVTNDSGLMHLAVAAGVPTVTIYGPTSPGSWNPGPPHRVLRAHGLACLECNRDRCPYGHECMAWVSAERVHREVEAVLEGAAA